VGEGIHTEVERVSRFIIVRKIDALTAERGITAQHSIFSALPPHTRLSVTIDNGIKVYRHYELRVEWGMDTYFVDPYAAC